MKKSILFLVLTVLCALPLQAEEPKDASPQVAKSTHSELEVLVTASRGQEQTILEIPQAVHSIGGSDIGAEEYSDLDEALRTIPNFGLAPAEGNPNYWQEGFTIRGLGAQRVLTLSNGVRQAGQGIGYGGGNLSLYDTFQVEKIEVITGPASVLYGTDAFGGVINIITRSPKKRDSFGTNGGYRYGFDSSRDMHRGGAYLDFGDQGYGAVFGGTYTSAQQPNLPDDEDPMSGSFKQWSFWGKADFHLSEDTNLRLIGDYNRNKDILVLDSDIPLPIAVFPPPGASAMIVSPLDFDFPHYNRSLLGAELETKKVSDLVESIKSGVYWQQISREFNRKTAFYPTGSPGFAGPPTFVDPSASVATSYVNTDDQVDTIEWLSQTRLNLGDHSLILGVDLGADTSELPETEIQQVVGQAGIGAIAGPITRIDRVRADADQMRYGIFAQDNFAVSDFSFTPGIRFDGFEVDDNQSDFSDSVNGLSGSLGTVYRVSEEQSLYLNLASGFRAPDLGERFQTGIVNLGAPTQIIGKEDLDPERSYSAEIGSKLYDQDFGFEVASFYNKVQDYVGLADLGIQRGFVTQQYDNVGDVEFYGGEALATYDLTDQFEVYGNLGRTWTGDKEKVDVADWTFNYGVRHHLDLSCEYVKNVETAINLRTLLDSEQKTTAAGREPFPEDNNFTTVDFQLNADIGQTAFGHGKIISGVRNIFNQSYREPFFTLLQPGRSGYIAVEFKF